MWGLFVSSTMKAGIHLGLNYEKNIERSSNAETSRMLETYSPSLKFWWRKILRKYWAWVRLTADHPAGQNPLWHLIKSRSGQKANVRIYSDSVLCLGRMSSSRQEASEKWSNQVNEFKMYCAAYEFYGIDGEAIEFERNISQDLQHCRSYRRPRKTCNARTWNQNDSVTGSYSCQCSTTLKWEKRNIEETCISNSERVKLYAQQIPQDHWTFIGPGNEIKWYGTRNCRLEGKWNSIAAKMAQNFKETKHPVFTSIFCFELRNSTTKFWRSSFLAREPSSSAEVRGLVIHDIKEVEGVRQQEEQEDKRDEEIGDEVNGEVERGLSTWRMRHDDDDGVNKAQTWATVCVHLSGKTVKGQRHQLTTKRDHENEGSTMHDDSCIGINYAHAHRFPSVSGHFIHIVGFRSVLRVISSILSPVTI